MAILDIKEKLRNLVDLVDGDLLRNGIDLLAHLVMDLEVAEKVGADRYERTDARQDYRNGTRSRTWETRVGPVELHIPKLRHSGFQPSFLEPRKRSERALLSVVQEAYINGVSTRKVESLVRAMGLEKFDKRRVSRACAELSDQVDEWRNRPLTEPCPYMWVDAKHIHVRSGARVVKKAFVVAYAVREDGYREVKGGRRITPVGQPAGATRQTLSPPRPRPREAGAMFRQIDGPGPPGATRCGLIFALSLLVGGCFEGIPLVAAPDAGGIGRCNDGQSGTFDVPGCIATHRSPAAVEGVVINPYAGGVDPRRFVPGPPVDIGGIRSCPSPSTQSPASRSSPTATPGIAAPPTAVRQSVSSGSPGARWCCPSSSTRGPTPGWRWSTWPAASCPGLSATAHPSATRGITRR